jgi:protein-disulfide isomerase
MNSESPNRRTQLIVLAAFAALIVIAAIVLSVAGGDDSDEPSGDPVKDSAQVEDLFDGIPQSGTFLGDPDTSVVVTEFADLQCPFCAEFARNVLPEVIDRHVRTDEIAMDLRLINILGSDSAVASEVAAAAAQQDHLWQFAETFYLNQGEENSGYVTDQFLLVTAQNTPGLDADQALEQRDSPQARALVAENEAAAQQLGVNSTPSFYISVDGGPQQEMQLSALTAEEFSAAIEAAKSAATPG